MKMVFRRDWLVNFLSVLSSIIAAGSRGFWLLDTRWVFLTLQVAYQNGLPLRVIAVY